ncbi:hypothetical protein, conserved [Eimeria necatrix]|uniref:Uncharacterized protein n=1 Tax=Eimeria necatrix TaxID=51315 RepID=U6MR63_9EIME|nr:hypothetical protein, conserved [Eimeria necatrix]CDJ64974.1 hypothetical protein, conserved [Eimeria necatrix]
MDSYAHKLPNLLEWSNRDVDYRALVATDWRPLIGALSNWEAKVHREPSPEGNTGPREPTKIFHDMGIDQSVLRSVRKQRLCNKLVLSVSDEAVPLEIELRHPADKKTTAILQTFPKTLRPARSAFGYAGQQHFLSSEETGLFARLRKGAVRRAKKSHGPKISMTVKPVGEDPNFLTIIFKAKGRMVHVVGRPLHMLHRIDPIQCEATRQMKSYLNYFQEQGSVTYRERTPWEGLPANRVQISYSSDEVSSQNLTALSHILQFLFSKDIVEQIIERFSQGLSFQLTTAGGMQGTINYLREWHLTKKLLHSAYPEARKLRIEQDTSEWHNLDRRHLQNMLRQSGVDGKPFKESWTVILNCSESVENIRWEVLDLDVADQAQMVVKQYAPDFGDMATMASAVEAELNLAASIDHVLKRMQETFFDYAHKRTLYIESPGAFLQFLIESDSRKLAREFENWLLERLQGSTRNKRCRRGSFYGKAYAQYTALVDYYEKLDLMAQVPDLDEVKRFLLTASLPRGHLVRIPHEEDPTHGGIYRVVERLDRCTFLLENADRLQVATDASLHVVRRFEDGDRISHQHTQRRHFKYVGKDATTGVCTIKDKQSYQFKVRQEETTSIRVGKFSEQTSKLRNGNWMLSDARSAYNTLLELDNNFMAEFEVGQSIVQDCYTGRACIIRDDRDFPVMVEYAMPGTIISNTQFGAPKARGTTTVDPAHMVVLQQTEQIVSKTAHAAYLLRREREESAVLGLKQHFKSKICGKHCAAWWLKANELKSMVKQFSETGQPAMTPQLEQSALAKALSTTTLVDYWMHRICMFEQTFRKLFARLRLPEEQDGSIPCSKVSAIIILAVAMSDVTLAIRRRAVATRKARLQRIADVLSFLEENDVPAPCTYELPEAADLLQIDIPSDSEECRQRDAATNLFMHMKSRIDAANVEVGLQVYDNHVIQQVRVRFTGTIYGRVSRLFVSSNEADYRLQETDFRELDSDISDLFAVLHRPFDVWQGTLKQLQNEELLNMRMQQQCPFRPPQPTRHAKEAVPGAHIQLIQGFLPFGYDDPLNSTLQEQGLYRHEKTVLLFTGLFLLQISARGSTFANSVIRFVLEEAAPDEFFKALEAFKKDVNFTEVASFLPPPVEGLDAKADTIVRIGDKAWHGTTLVTLEKIEGGVKFVRPTTTDEEDSTSVAITEPLFSAEKVSVGDLVNVSGSKVKYELLHITPLTSTTCVSKLRRKKSEEIILSREPLFRLSASQHDEVLGTTLDHIAGAYPKNELYVDLILFLQEFHKTEGARVSRTQFKKVLVILESHGRVSATEKESLQTTFDRRLNREAFYDAVDNVKKRTYDLLTDLRTRISSSSPPGANEELLFAWGSATIAALEAMWRARSLWRTLHRIFEMGLLKFFGEVNTLAQRPDILSALKVLNVDALREQGQKAITAYVVSSGKPLLLPSISDAVDKVSFESMIPSEARSTTLQFFNFVGDGVMPTKKALKMWEDYVTTVARRLEEFATQQDALDKYRKSLQSKDAAIPQSSLNASWTDKIVFRLSEVIGSLMKQELGNKLHPANIKSKLQPLLLQELVTVSELPLNSDGEDRLRHQYYQLSQKYVDQLVSSEVIDIDGVLDVIGQLEKALSNLLTPIIDQAIGLVKKAAQIISKPREKQEHYVIAFNALAASLEKIDTAVTPTEEKSEPVEVSGAISGTTAMSPMKDMGSLKRIYTRFLAKGAGAVSTAGAHLLSKITGTPIPDHLTNLLLIFWTPIRARALNAILKAAFSAFEGPNAAASALSVSNGLWNSAIQPVVDSMKVHIDIFTRLLGELDTGKGLTRDWWKEVPLLAFIRPMLYNVRSALLDPSNLYKFWYQIKIATSASSGLYKVLTAPVKGLGAYVYLLLIKILNGILPAENGDFLLPREFRGKVEERPDLDIVLANPKDLIKFLHRLFDVLLKVYVPMVRELFDTGIQLLLQKVARHLASDDGTLDMRRLLNNIADHDVDGEFEEVLRDLLFKIADDMLRLWPAMPLGSPQPWQQM